MQKSAFYAIVGISLFVTAASLGFTASRLLSPRYIAPSPTATGRTAAAGAPGVATLPPERWANLFVPDRRMDIPSKIAGTAKSEVPKTKFVLLGTIASDSKSARRAILWAEGMKQPRIDREGSELEPGTVLARIDRDFVMLAHGAAQEKLEILPVGSKTRSIAPPAPPATGGGAPAAAAVPGGEIRVTKLGENAYALDEATVGQITGNINQLMTNVRLIPYFEGNKSAGYRVAAVRPGSAFEQLGFRGGDVIQQVNNVDLSTPDKVYTIFQNLKDEKKVTVNILRQGQKSSINYEIR
jgi:general secretion pathway protein C